MSLYSSTKARKWSLTIYQSWKRSFLAIKNRNSKINYSSKINLPNQNRHFQILSQLSHYFVSFSILQFSFPYLIFTNLIFLLFWPFFFLIQLDWYTTEHWFFIQYKILSLMNIQYSSLSLFLLSNLFILSCLWLNIVAIFLYSLCLSLTFPSFILSLFVSHPLVSFFFRILFFSFYHSTLINISIYSLFVSFHISSFMLFTLYPIYTHYILTIFSLYFSIPSFSFPLCLSSFTYTSFLSLWTVCVSSLTICPSLLSLITLYNIDIICISLYFILSSLVLTLSLYINFIYLQLSFTLDLILF